MYTGNTLIISNGVSSTISPGQDISITVTGFKNPIDTDEVTGFTVTSMVKANDKYYPIDYGVGKL